MRVVIAGGHGKIALLLEGLLAGRGDQAVGLIRDPAQVADVQKTGAEAVVCDLEAASADDVAVLLSGADAVVFAAGAGPGSGVPRKDSVDRGASVLMAGAAERAGGRRFVQISAMGAGRPPPSRADEVWAAYITAKAAAEADLRSPALDLPIPPAPRPAPLRAPSPRLSPAARPPAPPWPRSPPPCGPSRLPAATRSNWSAATALSPQPCAASLKHGPGTALCASPQPQPRTEVP